MLNFGNHFHYCTKLGPVVAGHGVSFEWWLAAILIEALVSVYKASSTMTAS